MNTVNIDIDNLNLISELSKNANSYDSILIEKLYSNLEVVNNVSFKEEKLLIDIFSKIFDIFGEKIILYQ